MARDPMDDLPVPFRIAIIARAGAHLLERALRLRFIALKQQVKDLLLPDILWFTGIDQNAQATCVHRLQETEDERSDWHFPDQTLQFRSLLGENYQPGGWLIFLCDGFLEIPASLVETAASLSRIPDVTVVVISHRLQVDSEYLEHPLPVFSQSATIALVETIDLSNGVLDLKKPWRRQRSRS
jgi:hypothetical protein